MQAKRFSKLMLSLLLLVLASAGSTLAQLNSGTVSIFPALGERIRIQNSGPVTIRISEASDASNPHWFPADDPHVLEYDYIGNPSEVHSPLKRITVSARGIPEVLTLRATPEPVTSSPDPFPNAEDYNPVILTERAQDLVTGIRAHPNHYTGHAHVYFDAWASAPFPETTITVMYTLTH